MTTADPFGLEPYLHEHIPISQHLGVRVRYADADRVHLWAPLAANINHRQTGFGGSISALAILAGWSILWCRLRGRTAGHNIVIQRNSIEYIAPVTTDFSAECVAPDTAEWERFVRAFDERGRGRIELTVDVQDAKVPVARFTGMFVALRSS